MEYGRNSINIQFRSEFYNLPNSRAFGCTNNSTDGGVSFGESRCLQGTRLGRVIQVALKFFWSVGEIKTRAPPARVVKKAYPYRSHSRG